MHLKLDYPIVKKSRTWCPPGPWSVWLRPGLTRDPTVSCRGESLRASRLLTGREREGLDLHYTVNSLDFLGREEENQWEKRRKRIEGWRSASDWFFGRKEEKFEKKVNEDLFPSLTIFLLFFSFFFSDWEVVGGTDNADDDVLFVRGWKEEREERWRVIFATVQDCCPLIDCFRRLKERRWRRKSSRKGCERKKTNDICKHLPFPSSSSCSSCILCIQHLSLKSVSMKCIPPLINFLCLFSVHTSMYGTSIEWHFLFLQLTPHFSKFILSLPSLLKRENILNRSINPIFKSRHLLLIRRGKCTNRFDFVDHFYAIPLPTKCTENALLVLQNTHHKITGNDIISDRPQTKPQTSWLTGWMVNNFHFDSRGWKELFMLFIKKPATKCIHSLDTGIKMKNIIQTHEWRVCNFYEIWIKHRFQ